MRNKISLLSVFYMLCMAATAQRFHSYTADPAKDSMEMHYMNKGKQVYDVSGLIEALLPERKVLRFATNICMYNDNLKPLGLYIDHGIMLQDVKSCSGKANFCIRPWCIFYIGYDNKAGICPAGEFKFNSRRIKYAVQLAPMVVIKGEINPVISSYKENRLIRSGVGMLPDGKVVFALSEDPVSFFELARWFKESGCVDASYIDGNVSRMYYPEEGLGFDDEVFAVLFAVTVKQK